ncbi:MAG: hypothetical protein KC983_01625 [Phycisphaerales bacterium]|nr:hypothetical protein [Phycisphaerales bacterium]
MHDTERHDDASHAGEPRKGISPIAKIIVVLSIVLMIAGGALKVVGMTRADDAPPTPDATTSTDGVNPALQPSGFAATEPGSPSSSASGEESPNAFDVWSPALFKLGFSFFVGFCIGYAVRTFVKISIVAIGFILLVLFGLQYFGIVDVDWSAAEGHYATAMDWLKNETASFTTFIKGTLPSATSVMAGLVFGFRRK